GCGARPFRGLGADSEIIHKRVGFAISAVDLLALHLPTKWLRKRNAATGHFQEHVSAKCTHFADKYMLQEIDPGVLSYRRNGSVATESAARHSIRRAADCEACGN